MASAFGITLKKTGSQTGLVFSTGSLNSMKTLKGEGACCAIIADWISRSKKLGRSVRSAAELSPPTAYIVAFGPEDFKNQITADWDINVMESFSLSPHEIKHYEPVVFTTLATYIASNTGYLWVRIYGSNGGHSVGFFVNGSVFEYMDPNVGLYRLTDSGAFISHVATQLSTNYANLNAWSKVYNFV